MPRTTDSTRRIRLGALAIAATCVGLGLLAQVGRTPVLDVIGSVLYVVLVGMLVVVAAPRLAAVAVALIGFALAAVVELLQLTPLPDLIGGAVPVARLVLGNAFDPVDLVAYAVGAVLLYGVRRALRAARPAVSQPGTLP